MLLVTARRTRRGQPEDLSAWSVGRESGHLLADGAHLVPVDVVRRKGTHLVAESRHVLGGAQRLLGSRRARPRTRSSQPTEVGSGRRLDWQDGIVLRLCVMERVGVRELRQNLSVYLRRVRAGERFEVTERGVAVARLEPIVDASDPIARLDAEGRIVRRARRDLARVQPLKLRLDRPLSALLDELRQERL